MVSLREPRLQSDLTEIIIISTSLGFSVKRYHFRFLREWKWVQGYETQVIGSLKISALVTSLVMSMLVKEYTSHLDQKSRPCQAKKGLFRQFKPKLNYGLKKKNNQKILFSIIPALSL